LLPYLSEVQLDNGHASKCCTGRLISGVEVEARALIDTLRHRHWGTGSSPLATTAATYMKPL
jgi:hypothetical protein